MSGRIPGIAELVEQYNGIHETITERFGEGIKVAPSISYESGMYWSAKRDKYLDECLYGTDPDEVRKGNGWGFEYSARHDEGDYVAFAESSMRTSARLVIFDADKEIA